MNHSTLFGTLLAVAMIASTGTMAGSSPRRHHRHHVHAATRLSASYGAYAGPSYGAAQAPTPDCRYPDGTPFDPDIIGGANHVGDGGPAVNLGGFDPCGY